jgi:hypothetical protein
MERALIKALEASGDDAEALHDITMVISPAAAHADFVPVCRLFQVGGLLVWPV